MADLRAKEMSAPRDWLNYEQTLAKKYRALASRVTEPGLRQKFSQIADRHLRHLMLLAYLK